MKKLALLAATALIVAAAPTPGDIEAAAPASAWITVAPDALVQVTTPRGKFLLQLAPDFAPAHVTAIRDLVRAGAFNGGAVVRVQDNYVVQFAAAEAKIPPRTSQLAPEFERPLAGLAFTPLSSPDAYADAGGFVNGWPAATDRQAKTVWLQHCYGMVGVGRGNAPDNGDGSELYAVIGHAPRHLDRNMAVAGRIVSGIEQLSSLPRGTEALGFYKTPAEQLAVTAAVLVSDLPAGQRPTVMVMDTASTTFAAYVRARANRSDAFFVRPAGAVDACNVRVPVRITP
jgi:peptidylprolyl isomerase